MTDAWTWPPFPACLVHIAFGIYMLAMLAGLLVGGGRKR